MLNETPAVQPALPPEPERRPHGPRPDLPRAGREVAHGRRIATDAQIAAVYREYKGVIGGKEVVGVLHQRGLAASNARAYAVRRKLYPGRIYPRGKPGRMSIDAVMAEHGAKSTKTKPAPITEHAEEQSPLTPLAEALKAAMVANQLSVLHATMMPEGRLVLVAETTVRLEV